MYEEHALRATHFASIPSYYEWSTVLLIIHQYTVWKNPQLLANQMSFRYALILNGAKKQCEHSWLFGKVLVIRGVTVRICNRVPWFLTVRFGAPNRRPNLRFSRFSSGKVFCSKIYVILYANVLSRTPMTVNPVILALSGALMRILKRTPIMDFTNYEYFDVFGIFFIPYCVLMASIVFSTTNFKQL